MNIHQKKRIFFQSNHYNTFSLYKLRIWWESKQFPCKYLKSWNFIPISTDRTRCNEFRAKLFTKIFILCENIFSGASKWKVSSKSFTTVLKWMMTTLTLLFPNLLLRGLSWYIWRYQYLQVFSVAKYEPEIKIAQFKIVDPIWRRLSIKWCKCKKKNILCTGCPMERCNN